MNDIHPTATGGDGRVVPRRTTYQPGDNVQDIVHCANCGLPFRVGKDSEGNSIDNAPSDTAVVTTVDSTIKLPYLLQDNPAFLVSSVTTYDQSATNGCRFCHSTNPRGKGRNDGAFESGVDMSNR